MKEQGQLEDRPADDSGAETLARYDFQINLTSLACVQMMLDSNTVEIICEWHEDYVVVRSGYHELVSVKHIEPSLGSWTFSKIMADGGIKHLFDRWIDGGKVARCRLQTNGGLRTGPNNASAIKAASTDDEIKRVSDLMCSKLGDPPRDDVEAFLRVLTIEDSLPKRDDLLAKIHSELATSCAQLDWAVSDIEERFEAIRRAVAKAASTDQRAVERAIDVQASSLSNNARVRVRKTLNRQLLKDFVPGKLNGDDGPLVQKLRRGGFLPTAVERCRRLRMGWLAVEHRWSSELPGDEDPRAKIQFLAELAESSTRLPSETYGVAMRDELQRLLDDDPMFVAGTSVSTELALGAAYDESDHCRIWWSDPFEIEKPR